jgi:hypothetical protein
MIARFKSGGTALRLPMILQRHHAIQRSAQGEGLQGSFVELHLISSLIVLLLLAGEIGGRRRAIRFQLGCGLLLLLLRIRELQFGLFAFNH